MVTVNIKSYRIEEGQAEPGWDMTINKELKSDI